MGAGLPAVAVEGVALHSRPFAGVQTVEPPRWAPSCAARRLGETIKGSEARQRGMVRCTWCLRFLPGSRRYRCCPPVLSTVPHQRRVQFFDPTGMPMDSTRHHVIGTGGGETRRRQPDNRADPLPYLHGKRIRRNRICSYTSRSVIIASDLAFGLATPSRSRGQQGAVARLCVTPTTAHRRPIRVRAPALLISTLVTC